MKVNVPLGREQLNAKYDLKIYFIDRAYLSHTIKDLLDRREIPDYHIDTQESHF